MKKYQMLLKTMQAEHKQRWIRRSGCILLTLMTWFTSVWLLSGFVPTWELYQVMLISLLSLSPVLIEYLFQRRVHNKKIQTLANCILDKYQEQSN